MSEDGAGSKATWLTVVTLLISIAGNVLQYQKNASDARSAAETLVEVQKKNASDAALAQAQIENLRQTIKNAAAGEAEKTKRRSEEDDLQNQINQYTFQIRGTELLKELSSTQLQSASESGDKERVTKLQVEVDGYTEKEKNLETLRQEARESLAQLQKQ